MKFLAKFLACSFINVMLVTCAPSQDRSEDLDLNEIIEMCAEEIGLLVEETIRSFAMPLEPPGDCIVTCVFKKIGLVDSNGKIIKEEIIASIKEALKESPSLISSTENNFYECVDEANFYDGDCIVISEYFKCLIKDLLILDNEYRTSNDSN